MATQTDVYPRLLRALDTLRQQWRTQQLLTGSLLALAGSAAVLIGVVAMDNLFQFGPAGRVLLAAALWGSAALCVLGFVVRRWLEDHRDDYFAALVEAKHPELGNRLINALQLGRGNQRGFSTRLIEAIVEDADRATATMDLPDSIDGKPTRRALGIALAILVFIAGYAAALTPRFVNGLERVLLPLADIAPFSNTQIVEVKPGKARVPEGASIHIDAKIAGVIPAEARLLRKSGGKEWNLAMVPSKGDANIFNCLIAQANESFDYQVFAGDGRSQEFHVDVVKRPQVERISLTYLPPAYTGAAERAVDESDGEISAIPGTQVGLTIKATKPLHKAQLLTQDGQTLAFKQVNDSSTWKVDFTIWNRGVQTSPKLVGAPLMGPTTYQLKLEDTDGYDNSDPLWHSLTVARDLAPSVQIAFPGRDLNRVPPNGTVNLRIESRDDYGLGAVRVLYRINKGSEIKELVKFAHDGPPRVSGSDTTKWELAGLNCKDGDQLEYWASAVDRNDLTGPGKTESRLFSIFFAAPDAANTRMETRIEDYVKRLTEILRLQRENRAAAETSAPHPELLTRQVNIREQTRTLARLMEKDGLPVGTMVKSLDDLATGLMADALKLFEQGKTADAPARENELRTQSLPIQEKIIAELEAMLERLQRNSEAREAIKKIEKKDPGAQKEIVKTLAEMIKDLTKIKEQAEDPSKYERLPKKTIDEAKNDKVKLTKEMDELGKKWEKWTKGKVNELTKLPEGFIDDFKARKDVNKIFEEIEKSATQAKAEKAEVALEDLGSGLPTKAKEDLEMWLPDASDSTKWVLEEPLDKKKMKIPEMPLPKALEDMVGDLLAKEDEFDKDADDVTSAWGDNLDQAGWGASDGPISTFSAKGKTGNDLPNKMELSGRSGDGRRGQSSGQMVGDTSRALQGRKTPARVTNEKYEPGQLKQEAASDPNGATGGGKKAGAGKKGLQGGSMPEDSKDIGRLTEKQAALRAQAKDIAKKLSQLGLSSSKLDEAIQLLESSEKDMADHRYEDASRKRKTAMSALGMVGDVDTTAAQLSQARDLPPQLRQELVQSADEGLPAGYETLLKNYFKTLSAEEK